MANKAELQQQCDDLGIKYQDNDTNEQLELMIKGKNLQNVVDDLSFKLTEQQETIDEKAAEIEALDAQLAEQRETINVKSTEIESMSTKLAEQQEVMDAQNAQIDELTLVADASEKKILKLGDAVYEFVGKEHTLPGAGGKLVTYDDLKSDKALLKDCVKADYGFLRKIEK